MRRAALILVPYIWLLALFMVPFLIVLKISLSDTALAIPPYIPTLDISEGSGGVKNFFAGLDFENFTFIGAGAVFVAFLVIVLLGAAFLLLYRRLKKAVSLSESEPSLGDTFSAILVTIAVSVIIVALVVGIFALFFPALRNLVIVEDPLYFVAYGSSLKIATISTILTLIVGYPIAYGMANAPDHWRPTLMMLVILPFWTSFLIRVYSWMGILSTEGYLNQLLMGLGLIGEPLTILNTNTAVYIGIVYTYLPFMILPIYSALERLDGSLLEAAEDLGCSRISAFWLVTIPLSKSGIIAGSFLVFIPTLGEFVIPSLLGGSQTLMIGKVLWEEFFNNRDWPVAAAVAVILLLILIIPIILFQRNEQKQREAEG